MAYLEFFVHKLSLCQIDVQLDMFSLIVWLNELCLVDEWRISFFLRDRHDRHACHIHDSMDVLIEGRLNLWALAD